jgi:hypothetical protein
MVFFLHVLCWENDENDEPMEVSRLRSAISQDLVAKFSSELAGEVAADAQRKHPQPKVDSYPCRYIKMYIYIYRYIGD